MISVGFIWSIYKNPHFHPFPLVFSKDLRSLGFIWMDIFVSLPPWLLFGLCFFKSAWCCFYSEEIFYLLPLWFLFGLWFYKNSRWCFYSAHVHNPAAKSNAIGCWNFHLNDWLTFSSQILKKNMWLMWFPPLATAGDACRPVFAWKGRRSRRRVQNDNQRGVNGKLGRAHRVHGHAQDRAISHPVTLTSGTHAYH